MKRLASILYQNLFHHLDHLAPLCISQNIPLIVSDKKIYRSTKHFYTALQAIYVPQNYLNTFVVKNFDIVFFPFAKILFEADFFIPQFLQKKKVLSIWCPHGNSDKGWDCSFFEALKHDDLILVYGQKMIDFLKKKNVNIPYIKTGNYRFYHYLQYKSHYEPLVLKALKNLNLSNQSILFAPSWEDSNQLIFILDQLLFSLPQNFNLIIKLHPNTYTLKFKEIFLLQKKYEMKKNILFLEDFPLIYPLLHYIDIYLGDISSIGYDFLTFNKPMFFLSPSHKPSNYLHRCGICISDTTGKNIFQIIKNNLSNDQEKFFDIRKKEYDYTFGKNFPVINETVINAALK